MSRTVAVSAKAHIPALDGVRGLAVLIVMTFHFFQGEHWSDFPIGRALTSISHVGQTGVDLFFVLSGFLITGILLDAKGSPHYFKNFYVRRVLRIFPLQYAALAFFFFVLPLIANVPWVPFRDQLWGWLYAVNIHTTFSSQAVWLPGHFWSLAVEEHFYFIWPAVVLLCSRRRLYDACLLCIVMSVATRLLLVRLGYPCFYFTLARLDSLAVGGLLALFVRRPKGLMGLSDLKSPWLLGGLALILVPLWVRLSGGADPSVQVYKFVLMAVLYAALVVAALDPTVWFFRWFFSNRLLTVCGKYSYGLYVWDGIILLATERWTSHAALSHWVPGGIPLMVACLLAQYSTIFLTAFLSWHLMEKRFLALKRFFEYDLPAPKAAAEMTEPKVVTDLRMPATAPSLTNDS